MFPLYHIFEILGSSRVEGVDKIKKDARFPDAFLSSPRRRG